MQQIIEKNDTCSYQLLDHRIVTDETGDYYCRAADTVLWDGISFCKDCPLCKGEIPFNQCRYFGLAIPKDRWDDIILTPETEKTRVDSLKGAGLAAEFPEFVEPDDTEDRLRIEKAIRFAAEWHKGAVRKGNNIPYIVHPMETMGIVSKMTDDADTICAAALHDVIEDTECTPEILRENFGEHITELVCTESENKRKGQPKDQTWHIRKVENLKRIEGAPVESKMIMLADKVSNMRSSVRDFREGGGDIWAKFNMKDVKQQAWYYKSVAYVLKDLSYLRAYQEYIGMLEEVFRGVDTPPLVE
ncbi:MAG: bifunctional (p)ppGpp synthetase/guanosine-3',5'-bis(diphosphate) 3'-pyrophosphohydrolase [Lachnospiraceae bacterium]|uniref:Bifunctional (P)ppGpp synthetase/guanosine-3',5'-bis(Diphosphate) 3'-pyrophosphohydrolase n=1 Tax=Candidatus Weimeria bifida TaxID=2599074 RepID=A0A6N7J1D5_9FIRM|nr:bifunctional (p)ppGpp synthetase/guanosine-3',5'-bis(diphosphate) 3'-pyrophosphohydrolase [Candidatus Weimeria bifida]RRF96559.1 MAG: bifunctional (p)ppGpp synthetase/guanosine-3',5'-bis(diphosphate) 3'-pyrophosphohydrolase [Lachnospiraceae bacterium]